MRSRVLILSGCMVALGLATADAARAVRVLDTLQSPDTGLVDVDSSQWIAFSFVGETLPKGADLNVVAWVREANADPTGIFISLHEDMGGLPGALIA